MATDPNQPLIGQLFRKLQPLLRKWKTITSSVCHYLAKDMMPYSTVNNISFQSMLRTFEFRYVLPDRKAKLHTRDTSKCEEQGDKIYATKSCVLFAHNRYLDIQSQPQPCDPHGALH